MTEIEQECAAALVQALLEGDVQSARLPRGCRVIAKTAPMTYMVSTPHAGVVMADCTELRYAWR